MYSMFAFWAGHHIWPNVNGQLFSWTFSTSHFCSLGFPSGLKGHLFYRCSRGAWWVVSMIWKHLDPLSWNTSGGWLWNESPPTTTDLASLQFAYHHSRSTADAILRALYPALDHLGNRNKYIRLLFINYNLIFNIFNSTNSTPSFETLAFVYRFATGSLTSSSNLNWCRSVTTSRHWPSSQVLYTFTPMIVWLNRAINKLTNYITGWCWVSI